MKLPIKKEYFDEIESGKKTDEYRDAHITFVCEETGRTITKHIKAVYMVLESYAPEEYRGKGLFEDEKVIKFELE